MGVINHTDEATGNDQITASEMKQHFGKYLDAAQRAPVTIKKNGRPTAVLVSFEDYQKNIAVDNVDLNYWTAEFDRLSEQQLTTAAKANNSSANAAHDALFGADTAQLAAAHQTGFAKRGF